MPPIRLLLSEASEGHLPAVCMRCGEPATVTKTKEMVWCPQWVAFFLIPAVLLFPVGTLLYIILDIGEKSAPRHNNYPYIPSASAQKVR